MSLPNESHISSLVVQALPGRSTGVEAVLRNIDGAKLIHEVKSEVIVADTQQDRIVVVIEAPGMRSTQAFIEAVKELEGVLSVAMIYHHAEPSTLLEEEIA